MMVTSQTDIKEGDIIEHIRDCSYGRRSEKEHHLAVILQIYNRKNAIDLAEAIFQYDNSRRSQDKAGKALYILLNKEQKFMRVLVGDRQCIVVTFRTRHPVVYLWLDE